jgi:IS30 family transposase
MACHQDFTRQTLIPVYFCDPASPWQRGSNENTNGLLRQYFPKGTDLGATAQNTSLGSPLNSTGGHARSWVGRVPWST